MTTPRIEVLEHNQVITVLHCTGCDQESSYADYLTDLTPDEYLRQCIREASEHDCFMAGRVGYVVTPFEEDIMDKVVASGDSPGVRDEVAASIAAGRNVRDAAGRCLTCLRFGEKQALLRRAQNTNDSMERVVLLERARIL